MKKILLSVLAVSAMVFTSCKKEEVKDPVNEVVKPTTYTFKDAAGTSTVSHGGQTARLAMANEIKSNLGDPASTQASLEDKFTKGTGFSADVQALNTSDKKIASSVAIGSYNDLSSNEKAAYKALVSKTLVDFTSIEFAEDAKNGQSGFLMKGDKKVYVTAKGVEQNQLFAKTVIGSMCLDQVVNKYLDPQKLTKNATNKEGKNYTEAQHHWDEAYGYVFGEVNGGNAFLGKYLIKSVSKLKAFEGLDKKIMNAFIDGRHALVTKNNDVVKTSAEFIRENLSKVVCIKAMSYLIKGKGTKDGSTIHALSEGLGFMHSLRFARVNGKQLTEGQVDGVFAMLGSRDVNFFTVEDAQLDAAAAEIAKISGISVVDATTGL